MSGSIPGGITVAAVTPCREGGQQIDLGAVYELIDYLAAFPIGGIAFLGSTGEFLHFDFEERAKLLERVVRRSRVPVVANVSHSTLAGALELAEQATAAGAAALLLMPPYYFRYPAEDVEEFYLRFRAAVRAPIPLILYHIPKFTSAIPLATARRLMNGGGYSGIKDSSGDWEYCSGLLEPGHSYTVLSGNDALFVDARRGGAAGAVSGVACAVPELMVALDRAVISGDASGIDALRERLGEFLNEIANFPAPFGIKEATRLRGIHTGPSANPLGPEGRARCQRFQAWFQEWLTVVQRESTHAR